MIKKRVEQQAAGAEEAQVAYIRQDAVIGALGGHQNTKMTSLQGDYEKGQLVRRGLPKKSASHLQRILGLTNEQMSKLLAISHRTFQRKQEEDVLGAASSEQLIEIAEVIAHALELFGTYDDVHTWLRAPLIGLQGQRPIDLLDNTFNIRQVSVALSRLEHGIYA